MDGIDEYFGEQWVKNNSYMCTESTPILPKYYLGLDLGQVNDYTALTLTERTTPSPRYGTKEPCRYFCQKIKRMRTVSYPEIVKHVAEVIAQPELKGKCLLVVDGTGVGRGVVDIMRDSGLKLTAITITSGNQVTFDSGYTRVPKVELAGIMQVLLQSERLKIQESEPDAQTLLKELLNFKVKITTAANATFAAGNDWREGAHDDLVLSLAMAMWQAERQSRQNRTTQPHYSHTSSKVHG